MMQPQQQQQVALGQPSAQKLKERLHELRSLETMDKEETLRVRLSHVGPSVALFFPDRPLKMVQGKGQYLYDELGTEYLDCINNVSHVGHANRRVLEAVSKQLGQLNTNSRFLHDSLSTYARRLTGLFPSHLSVCYLVNSGSEANDLAIRLARAYTGRKDIVCVDGGYHGNLSSTMAISPYKNLKPMPGMEAAHRRPKWAHVALLPCAYRGQFRRGQPEQEPEEVGRLYADASERLMQEVSQRGRQVAALIVESMISCGGQTPLPAGYLAQLERYLRARHSLLICDEVQTGFGRCGKHMWAFQLAGAEVKPDIVTIGKPMGNGFPLAAVVCRPEIARAFQDIGTEYFNTYGGNPVSCAAGLAVLDELEEKQLMKHAYLVGSHMMRKLELIGAKSKIVGDVRGEGLFIGIELVESKESRKAAPELAKQLVNGFREERILMNTEGKEGNILKFKPPMVFTMDNADRFLQVFERLVLELELQLAAAANQDQQQDLQNSLVALPTKQSPSDVSASSCSSASSTISSSSSWLDSSTEL